MNYVNWSVSPLNLQAIRTELQRRDYNEWLRAVSPDWHWDWRHLVYLRAQLAKVTAGTVRRMIVEMPPRHGKSEGLTVRYSAWRIERDPTTRVIIGAYNQTLANKFSRKARKLLWERVRTIDRVREVVYPAYADGLLLMNEQRRAADDWETAQGGGLRAVGVGGGITGQGGNLIVVDDPVKSREEANSPTTREKVWEWFTDDLYTRLEPDAALIIIMTRWHEDDLVGRVLEHLPHEDWLRVRLPAEAEADDPLGREPGEALCPERYDLEALGRIRQTLGNSYYALYQQRPQPIEGGMFKRGWFAVVDRAPYSAQRVRYWDKAATAGSGAYTVGVLMARDDAGTFYVEDVVRGQWSTMEREAVILRTAQADAQRYGLVREGQVYDPGVETWIEQEPGSGGADSARHTIRNLAGFSIHAERPTGDKAVRAEPLAAQAEAGNVKLVRGEWNRAYLDELALFPYGTYKDQVDASSGAFNKLAAGAVWEAIDVPLGEWRG